MKISKIFLAFLFPTGVSHGHVCPLKRLLISSRCYFVNSGTEANDIAMMLMRGYTGNWDIICHRNSDLFGLFVSF